MSGALWFLIIILGISAVFTAALNREYLRVTQKRRELIAALGGSGRAVPRFKHALMSMYIASTVFWTIVLLVLFIRIS